MTLSLALAGTISGLEIGKEYFCTVTEDPEEAKKEKKTYKAQGKGEIGIKINTGRHTNPES